jgi:hypothetical protein
LPGRSAGDLPSANSYKEKLELEGEKSQQQTFDVCLVRLSISKSARELKGIIIPNRFRLAFFAICIAHQP